MPSKDSAISLMVSVASRTCSACCPAATASWPVVAIVSLADSETVCAVMLIPVTSSRSCSTAKLTESAMAPVISSVTVAFTVRSPSASELISSSRRMIACWFFWFCIPASTARRLSAPRNDRTISAMETRITISAREPDHSDGHKRVPERWSTSSASWRERSNISRLSMNISSAAPRTARMSLEDVSTMSSWGRTLSYSRRAAFRDFIALAFCTCVTPTLRLPWRSASMVCSK